MHIHRISIVQYKVLRNGPVSTGLSAWKFVGNSELGTLVCVFRRRTSTVASVVNIVLRSLVSYTERMS